MMSRASAVASMVIGLVAATLTSSAGAAVTFAVNSTADVVDAAPGNGICDTGNTAGAPPVAECTLRAAVQEANAAVGSDTIDVPPGQYVLSIDGSESAGTPDAAVGDLDLTDDTVVDGGTSANTVVRPSPAGGTQAQGISRLFETWNAASDISISDVELLRGNAYGESVPTGGGLRNDAAALVLERVSVNDSGACEGGGVAGLGGTLTLTETVVKQNDAQTPSGISCSSNNGAGVLVAGGAATLDETSLVDNDATDDGGGIYTQTGSALITDSTMSGNRAKGRGGAIGVAAGTTSVVRSALFDNLSELDGGAIYHAGSQLTLQNSTVSNNNAGAALLPGSGGALYSVGTATLENVTVAFNGASSAIGGVATGSGGSVSLGNTMIAGSVGDGAGGHECNSVTSVGGNIIENASGCTVTGALSTYTEGDPMLEGLTENGGVTPTHRPDLLSPALDGGDDALCLSEDQRGGVRPDDGPDANAVARCDIGSFEWIDTDNDALEDNDEVAVYLTDPNLADTDEDGLQDGFEVSNGSDPRNPCSPNAGNEACAGSLDSDGDGVVNKFDACDDQAEDLDGHQDADGCPEVGPDGDGDGVDDGFDDCEGPDEDMDGFQDNDGCPDPDNDGDGVLDTADNCDNQAEDVDGFQDSDGCPDPDNDGDGVLDGSDPAPDNSCVPDDTRPECDPDGDTINNAADNCDNQAEDVDGFQDSDGCPDPDNDGDGVLDTVDDCDDQAEDLEGFEDSDGCPEQGPDGDGDGVDDGFDDCEGPVEDLDGYQDNDGCPDLDNDSDGVDDSVDDAPNDPCIPDNSAGPCDRDSDGHVNADDNCPTVTNGSQQDANSNDVGDLCEAKHGRSIVEFKLRKHVTASGKVKVADSASLCKQSAAVKLELKTKKNNKWIWKVVASGKTNATGGFSLKAKDTRGSYRVTAPPKNVTYSGMVSSCSKTVSKVLTHRH